MNMLILLLALVPQAAEAKPAAAAQAPVPLQDGIEALERKRLVKEAERINLRNMLQEAREKKDEKESARLAAELAQAEQDLAALSATIEEKRKESGGSWPKVARLEGMALLTHWDNDLELKDSFGWGAALHLPDPLFFDYRRWEPRDELGNAGASVQSYGMGLHWEVSPANASNVTFTFSTSFGLVHLESDAHGSDSDTGWSWNARPRWEWQFTAKARFSVGADIDVMRTDFNQERTHTFHNFGAVFSLEFRL